MNGISASEAATELSFIVPAHALARGAGLLVARHLIGGSGSVFAELIMQRVRQAFDGPRQIRLCIVLLGVHDNF